MRREGGDCNAPLRHFCRIRAGSGKDSTITTSSPFFRCAGIVSHSQPPQNQRVHHA